MLRGEFFYLSWIENFSQTLDNVGREPIEHRPRHYTEVCVGHVDVLLRLAPWGLCTHGLTFLCGEGLGWPGWCGADVGA